MTPHRAKGNKEKEIEPLPKWARELHDRFCSWKCADEKIEINPKCKICGKSEEQSVGHKGASYLCNKDWNTALSRAIY